MTSRALSLFALLALLWSGCAKNITQYSDTRMRGKSVQALPADQGVEYEIFLVGDTGKPGTTQPPALQLLDRQLDNSGKNAAVVYLGDITFSGLPGKADAGREAAENLLRQRFAPVKDFPGEVFVLPGDLDWKYGTKGVRRLEEFVEDYLDRGNVFLPDNGCSGPESESLGKYVELIGLDSYWFIQDWDKSRDLNDNCDLRTRGQFLAEIKDEIKDNREKITIVATHHSIKSTGRHAGYYGTKSHLAPLPGIGSIITFLKANIGSRKSLRHPRYAEYAADLRTYAKMYGRTIFVGAHDRNLQYFQEKGQDYIVSGAGSTVEPVTMNDESTFTSGRPGFAKLTVLDNGAVWLTITTIEKGQPEGQIAFRQEIRAAVPTTEAIMPDEFTEYNTLGDSLVTSVLDPDSFKVYNQQLWGTLYTDEYFRPIKVPVLDLETFGGGLTAENQGGGFQTYSLRLADPDGRIYQMRSLKKYADGLPKSLRSTFVGDVLEQLYTAGNPYGAYLVNPMAGKVGLLHANPNLYYVPKQPRLGRFNDIFGGELYLLEERPTGDWSTNPDFANSDNLINTMKMVEERTDNYKAAVDDDLYLRSRFFDWVIGDWDRHQGQWRFAETGKDDEGRKQFKPVPQDRDQAFARYNGIGPYIARHTLPILRMMRPFDAEIEKKEIRWQNYNAIDNDNFFLSETTWADWEREARTLQELLTDEVIEEGLRWLPADIYAEMAPQLLEWTKLRRDNLLTTARDYYELLNEQVSVIGTNQENLFEVERLDNQTRVTVYEYRKGKERADPIQLYQRTFDNDVTEELHLYGLDDDDEFVVRGAGSNPIKVRLVGGNDKDIFRDESSSGKALAYDDHYENETGGRVVKRFTDRKTVNTWDFTENEYDFSIPLPLIGFNPDDGLLFGFGMMFQKYGFKRATIHTVNATFSTSTAAPALYYKGDFQNVFNKRDLLIEAAYQNGRYARNYYGSGNNTVWPQEDPNETLERDSREYYRTREERIELFAGLKSRFASGAYIAVGPLAESVEVDRTANRILVALGDQLDDRAFNRQYYGGARLRFNYENVDNVAIPTRGLRFNADFSYRQQLNAEEGADAIGFGRVNSSLSAFLRLGTSDQFVLATRVGGAANLSEDFLFFQAVTLGARENLRGYQFERFSGRSAVFHQTDLRIRLAPVKLFGLPATLGVSPGFDYGRVFADRIIADPFAGVDPDAPSLHLAYGGTVWVAPIDFIAINLGAFYAQTDERIRVTARVGWNF